MKALRLHGGVGLQLNIILVEDMPIICIYVGILVLRIFFQHMKQPQETNDSYVLGAHTPFFHTPHST